ncbi:hypothetical protein C6496_08655 [Candidatus Poribacteria bacterium]|nr:hypothetical protein [Candidatus Poribacteria bacterium]RKU37710.1 MAG: hypothetical protein C6496_08655 [Candidatus Poribacteria bacterium]
MKIPNAERAIVDIRKLRDYCLNSQNDTGKHKAHLFYVALGITVDDADALRDILLQAVKTSEAQVGRQDIYGQRYRIDFPLTWKARHAIIRSGWIIDPNSDVPRLLTAYPL